MEKTCSLKLHVKRIGWFLGYFWDVTVLFPAKLQVFMVTKHVEETKKNRAEMADSAFRTGLKTGRSKDKMTSKLSSFCWTGFLLPIKMMTPFLKL